MLSAFEGTSAQPSFLLEEEKPTVLWELTKVQDAWSMDSVGTAVIVDASAATTRLDLGKSVCGLKYLNMGGRAGGRTLIASGYTNQLALFDLRFPKAGPIQRYHEHVNDYRSGLGLAVDPSGTHVFAAGSDQRIRAWSIMNGQLVPDTRRQAGGQGQRRLLGDPYSALINGIEVSEDNRIHILNDRQLETYIQY
ncbi:hypothetical protein QFC19_005341 [Naganishia cerealis]|uniref:Uncharacterized protein n=1 Tax=Naganishia cerealis TaxID=610337 RepID=A0ACC2VNF7_9TREE|nr:hypothetical protein QFC19_005341 [Naganishia cerealis]